MNYLSSSNSLHVGAISVLGGDDNHRSLLQSVGKGYFGDLVAVDVFQPFSQVFEFFFFVFHVFLRSAALVQVKAFLRDRLEGEVIKFIQVHVLIKVIDEEKNFKALLRDLLQKWRVLGSKEKLLI